MLFFCLSPSCHFWVCYSWTVNACGADKRRYSFTPSPTGRNFIPSCSRYQGVLSYLIMLLQLSAWLFSLLWYLQVLGNVQCQLTDGLVTSLVSFLLPAISFGLIVNVTNFMFFVYSNLDGESYYTGVCLKFVFSSWSFLSMKLRATWEAFSQAPHEKHKQSLKVCIRCPSPSWTRLFPTSCLGASGGSCDIWIKLCNNNIDWSVFLVKVARLSCSVNTLSSCCYNLTF